MARCSSAATPSAWLSTRGASRTPSFTTTARSPNPLQDSYDAEALDLEVFILRDPALAKRWSSRAGRSSRRNDDGSDCVFCRVRIWDLDRMGAARHLCCCPSVGQILHLLSPCVPQWPVSTVRSPPPPWTSASASSHRTGGRTWRRNTSARPSGCANSRPCRRWASDRSPAARHARLSPRFATPTVTGWHSFHYKTPFLLLSSTGYILP